MQHLKERYGQALNAVIMAYRRMLSAYPFLSLSANVMRRTKEHLSGEMAAGIAYYAILSVFPLLLGIIALLGLFLPREAVKEEILRTFAFYLPESSGIIEANIRQIIAARGSLGIFSIIGLFWTGSLIFGSISRVINAAWGIRRLRPFWMRKVRDFAMALGTSLLFVLSIFSSLLIVIFPGNRLISLGLSEIAIRMASFLLIFSAFLLLYKMVPNTTTYWKYTWQGSLIAAFLFEASRSLFLIFVSRFTDWSLVYGQIGSIIAVLTWAYISSYILIIGAEFCAEYDRIHHHTKPDLGLQHG